MQDDVLILRMLLGVFNLAALLPEGVSRFHKRMHEYEEFSKKREKTKASMAAMKKEIESFVVKEKSWVVKVHELTKRHKIELNDVKKRMEADRLQLKADREALNVQQKAFLNEKEGLKASLSQATSDNQWLIEHGFQQVVTNLLHSTEFNSALGDVYTKLLNHGKHLGFVDLKPYGLNEAVCAEVLSSLSKKHSHSGNIEDTFSDIVEVSLETSIEGSEVAGDDRGRKKKKSKKGKKAKTVEAEVSKSNSDA
ncbi:hypothetical protein Hdeb2414_s0410g00888021 [Helianthus debilis subsp. tardiflorus]